MWKVYNHYDPAKYRIAPVDDNPYPPCSTHLTEQEAEEEAARLNGCRTRTLTHEEILAIEYFDQQLYDRQVEIYASLLDSDYAHPAEVRAEMCRILKGMKAHCLS